ncbi:unnamed protein product [Onchocerca flexuosa]|uniref:Ovule protein n=1 Tax=Onchocerca flexuosa TaxID=387005 RepID=A0A183H413_9BILA|nr:unnamed protein product [Onchocerca flexuosa]
MQNADKVYEKCRKNCDTIRCTEEVKRCKQQRAFSSSRPVAPIPDFRPFKLSYHLSSTPYLIDLMLSSLS